MSRTFSALRVRNYRRYAAGQLVANTGIWMQRVAQDWLVLDLTHGSAIALGLTVGLQFLPTLLLSLVGGSMADRLPRRALLMATSSTMGVLAGVLGAAVLMGAATLPVVMVLALLLGAVAAVDSPARQAFVSEMVDVEDLPNAVALGTASFNLGRVLGPSAAGLLIAAVGTGWVFVLNGLAFGAVLVALLGVRTSELREPVARSRDNGGLREGLRYVRASPDLVTVLVVAFFVGTFGLNFNLYLATMTSQVFHRGAEAFGIASTVLAVGSLAGSLAAARRGGPRLRLVVLAGVGFGLAAVTVSVMPTYAAFLVTLPLVGASALTVINAMQSYLQVHAAPEVRGRVLGIYLLLFIGGTPIGAPLMGWVADVAGPRWAIALGGTVSGLAAAVAGLTRLRRDGQGVRAHLTPLLPRAARAQVLVSGVVVLVVIAGWWVAVPARAAYADRLHAEVAFTVQDPRIAEASGMVAGRAMPDVTWLLNDSGNTAQVFGVDGSGRTVATATLAGVDNRDWEAMAPGTAGDGTPTLWIGDIGDNNAVHPSISLYQINEPTTPGDSVVDAKRYSFTYPDGPRDAEALMVDSSSGTIYVVTKQLVGAGIYTATDLVPGTTSELTRLSGAPSFVTDAAFDPSFHAVVLRTYTQLYLLPSVTAAATQRALLPAQPQGETIAWSPDGATVLSGSEGQQSKVYRVTLPAAWLAPSPTAEPSSSPTSQGTGSGVPVTALLVLGGVALVGGVVVAVVVSRAGERRSRSTR